MPELDPDLRALQEVRDLVERASRAQEVVAGYSQEETDALCEAMARAGAAAAHDLARLAVEETGIGRAHYKVLKNLLGSEGTWDSIRDEKTVGIVSRDDKKGILEVATPSGIVAGIVPTTNPTSTAMNKAIISVKGRNGIVISPHPRARRCIGEAVEVMRTAIERAGGPPDLVASLSNPTIDSTGALMKHPKIALILATGGSGLVRAAYSSGKPAYGVGPGNVPVYVDRSADVLEAARWIIDSQNFDNATLCCSEQALVLDRPIADTVLSEMQRRGAHLCNDEEVRKLEALCNRGGHMNPDIVGLDPWRVAEMAGFSVPRHTTLLLAHQGGVGKPYPLSIEILCPLLSVHLVDGWEEGCRVSLETLHSDGLGHTIGLWARDETVLNAWFLEKPANRIVVNGPTSEGATGYSTQLTPAMSLGCGPQAGNITSDNISARHLINIKRVAFRRPDWDSIHERDHARAAAMTGEVAPRGTGLPGDPGLGSGSTPARPAPSSMPVAPQASAPDTLSNWRGNPPVNVPRPNVQASGTPASPAPTPSGGSGAHVRPGRAPRFTAGSSSATARPLPASKPVQPAPKPQARKAPAAPGPHVGMALSPGEIEGILTHAGSGCPLGPCRGCPHHDVQTGACMA